MRVFVSSTVYDLLDIRKEVGEFISELGLVPVLSDESTSDFRVDLDRDSLKLVFRMFGLPTGLCAFCVAAMALALKNADLRMSLQHTWNTERRESIISVLSSNIMRWFGSVIRFQLGRLLKRYLPARVWVRATYKGKLKSRRLVDDDG